MQQIILKLFTKNKIGLNRKKFFNSLMLHPNYPDVISLNDTLLEFDIPFNVYQTTLNEIEKQIKCCVLFITDKNGNNVAHLLEQINVVNYRYKIDGKKLPNENVNEEEGIILVLKTNNQLKNNWIKRRVSVIFFIFLVLITLIVSSKFNLKDFSFYIFPFLGLFLSFLTIQELFETDSAIVNMICKKEECDSVINSKKWKLFEIVNLSDISLIFFLTQFILLFFSNFLNLNNKYFATQIILLILSIPFILLSLFYQKFVIKNWCVICLGVILILVLEYVYLAFFRKEIIYFDFIFILFWVTIFFINYCLWMFLKSLLKENKENTVFLNEKNRLLNNNKIFYSILKSSTKKHNRSSLYFNEKKKQKKHLEVLLITDPFCNHCKTIHFILKIILEPYRELLDFTIIFNVDIEDEPAIDKAIYRNLMNIQCQSANKFQFVKALDDWYSDENEKEWLNNYSSNHLDVQLIDNYLKQHRRWCLSNNLNYTPVLLIEGYLYPRLYDHKQLKYFIDYLIKKKNKLI